MRVPIVAPWADRESGLPRLPPGSGNGVARPGGSSEIGETTTDQGSLMPSTHKKVAVRTRERGWLCGHLDPSRLRVHGRVQWLSLEGQLNELPAAEVKGVFFIPGFDVLPTLATQRPAAVRPRLPGLWVRVDYPDGDNLYGVLANHLTELDGTGLFLLPATATSPFQRVYIPRDAMVEATVLGVVGRGPRGAPRGAQQFGLFPAPVPAEPTVPTPDAQ